MALNFRVEMAEAERKYNRIQNQINEVQQKLSELNQEKMKLAGEYRFLKNKAIQQGLMDEQGNWTDNELKQSAKSEESKEG